jgi:hypothetical protein
MAKMMEGITRGTLRKSRYEIVDEVPYGAIGLGG